MRPHLAIDYAALPGKAISPSACQAFIEMRDSLLGQLRSALAARTGPSSKS